MVVVDTGAVDPELMKRQAEIGGRLVDGEKVTDEEIADLEGVWSFLHHVVDQIEDT